MRTPATPRSSDLDLTRLAWRKSSRSASQNACVELAAVWRKSSRSAAQNECVELADAACCVAVRDSKRPAQPPLSLARPAWAAFARTTRGGRYDLG